MTVVLFPSSQTHLTFWLLVFIISLGDSFLHTIYHLITTSLGNSDLTKTKQQILSTTILFRVFCLCLSLNNVPIFPSSLSKKIYGAVTDCVGNRFSHGREPRENNLNFPEYSTYSKRVPYRLE